MSVDAGNAFLRRLAIKTGVALERLPAARCASLLAGELVLLRESSACEHVTCAQDLLDLLLAGSHNDLLFTPGLVGALVATCEVLGGKLTGYPHASATQTLESAARSTPTCSPHPLV